MSRNSWESMEICLMVKFNVFPSKKKMCIYEHS
jgi:hypothetical protein